MAYIVPRDRKCPGCLVFKKKDEFYSACYYCKVCNNALSIESNRKRREKRKLEAIKATPESEMEDAFKSLEAAWGN